MKRQWTAEQKEDIIKSYTEIGLTCAEIGRKYGAKYETISKYLKEWGIPIKGNKTSNRLLKEDYFSKIDSPEKAYFLGLLFADGSVILDARRNPMISLELNEDDKVILEAFKNEVNSNASFHYNKRANRKNGTYTFSFRSERMAEDLSNYNIVPNKTYVVTKVIPPDNYLIDFLRGYIDGDGSLYFSGKFWHLSITGHTKEIIEQYRDLVDSLIGNTSHNSVTCYHDIYKVTWNGKKAIKLMSILYNDATIYLPRKRAKAMAAQENKMS